MIRLVLPIVGHDIGAAYNHVKQVIIPKVFGTSACDSWGVGFLRILNTKVGKRGVVATISTPYFVNPKK